MYLQKEMGLVKVYAVGFGAILLFSLCTLCLDYEFYDLYLIAYIASFFVFGWFIVRDFLKNRILLSIGIVFNVFGLLYTNYYITERILLNQPISESNIGAMCLAYISMLSFDLSYYNSTTLRLKGRHCQEQVFNIDRVRNCSIVLLLVSIAIGTYIIMEVGIARILFQSRGATALLMRGYSFLVFYRFTFALTSSIFLYLYLRYRKLIDLGLFGLAFVLAFLSAVLYGSRADMLSLCLPVMFLLLHFKIINNKKMFIVCVGMFLLFGIWKSLYYQSTHIDFLYSEFTAWYTITSNVLDDPEFQYLYGESYLVTLINLIVPVTGMEALSVWYMKTYLPVLHAQGFGKAFSGVLEAYMNFGVVGNILVYAFHGFIFSQLKTKNAMHIILYTIFLTSINRFFRSESFALWKSMTWFCIYPTLFIFLISKYNLGKKVDKLQMNKV